MITISKPISARQAQKYHKEEFADAVSNYYTEGERVVGEWQGKLAADLGLKGEVSADQFARLSEGQHPLTGRQLVAHCAKRECPTRKGKTVHPMEHRAGWDATFSAPKSVSLTALVGGDERIRVAHWESVRASLDAMEHYVQARVSKTSVETTAAWVVAKFEHDSSRPVEGYSAPQLHTHAIIFNVTQTRDGQTRSLQPRELYRSQKYGTAVYRAELAVRLQSLGYEIERGEHAQPEIKGYSAEYLRASSPRRQQIEENLREKGVSGARAAQIAAHQTRESKKLLPRKEVLAEHQRMAHLFGYQPQQVVSKAALGRRVEATPKEVQLVAQEAIVQACESNMERTAVADERALLSDALKYAMGTARLPEVQTEFERAIADQHLIELHQGPSLAGRIFTTPEMQQLESELILRMQTGRGHYPVLASGQSREWALAHHAHLSVSQRHAVEHILMSHDLMTALDGVAGAGKTTSLTAIVEAAFQEGYEIKGLAPTSRAAEKLSEAGLETETLQMHLTRDDRLGRDRRRLYIVDESSMVSTQQMYLLMTRLKKDERILLTGDRRQHEAVEAGRPYAQLQENGMRTAQLTEILRQKDPGLRTVVEQLAGGEIKNAIAQLNVQGRVHEVEDYDERIRVIAREYVREPKGTLVVSPDNQSRREINASIHCAMQDEGLVQRQECTVRVLRQRQDLTEADRRLAQNYEHGDILRYQRSSKVYGIKAGEYARVKQIDSESNMLTVEHKNGEELIYDPRRLQGVQVHREYERHFAEGDRIQLTASYHAQKLSNCELGIIKWIDEEGNFKLEMDSGRKVAFNSKQHPHLDYGYAVTSYSSQGQTADRVLIHIDSGSALGPLLNERFAYVAISRAQYDAQIFTDDASSLALELSRNVSKSSALQQKQAITDAEQSKLVELTPQFGIEISN